MKYYIDVTPKSGFSLEKVKYSEEISACLTRKGFEFYHFLKVLFSISLSISTFALPPNFYKNKFSKNIDLY